ncbi:hypothetical protein NHX12_023537 [Muraenolepis orangiensis]|uniref:MAP7 domain-containing protein 1 n=1 Tax=Muraenolepis orangiensis TaxID=630683 RepID=A0A9Q0ISU7_9TELE|nr:hypothetical protein NHX12_023537 [Muraenolepis orangiensis]
MKEDRVLGKGQDPDPLSPGDSAVTDLSPNSESCPKTDPSSSKTDARPTTPGTSPQPKKDSIGPEQRQKQAKERREERAKYIEQQTQAQATKKAQWLEKEDRERYESAIKRSTKKTWAEIRQQRWSWAGGLNQTSRRESRCSASTVNLPRQVDPSVINNRLSKSSATLWNSPSRSRSLRLSPWESRIVERLMTPTLSFLARSRSAVTLHNRSDSPSGSPLTSCSQNAPQHRGSAERWRASEDAEEIYTHHHTHTQVQTPDQVLSPPSPSLHPPPHPHPGPDPRPATGPALTSPTTTPTPRSRPQTRYCPRPHFTHHHTHTQVQTPDQVLSPPSLHPPPHPHPGPDPRPGTVPASHFTHHHTHTQVQTPDQVLSPPSLHPPPHPHPGPDPRPGTGPALTSPTTTPTPRSRPQTRYCPRPHFTHHHTHTQVQTPDQLLAPPSLPHHHTHTQVQTPDQVLSPPSLHPPPHPHPGPDPRPGTVPALASPTTTPTPRSRPQTSTLRSKAPSPAAPKSRPLSPCTPTAVTTPGAPKGPSGKKTQPPGTRVRPKRAQTPARVQPQAVAAVAVEPDAEGKSELFSRRPLRRAVGHGRLSLHTGGSRARRPRPFRTEPRPVRFQPNPIRSEPRPFRPEPRPVRVEPRPFHPEPRPVRQREREEQERQEQEQKNKLLLEEAKVREVEERRLREEESRLMAEQQRLMDEEQRLQEEKEAQEKAQAEQEENDKLQKQREEAEVKAKEEAEKQRVEREKHFQKEEQERLERKRRLEEIMKRTRKSDAGEKKDTKASSQVNGKTTEVPKAPGSSQNPQEPMNNGAANAVVGPPPAVSGAAAVNGVQPAGHQNGLSPNVDAAKFGDPILAYEGGEPFMMKTGPMKPQHVAEVL